jgi:hypothetical protein
LLAEAAKLCQINYQLQKGGTGGSGIVYKESSVKQIEKVLSDIARNLLSMSKSLDTGSWLGFAMKELKGYWYKKS